MDPAPSATAATPDAREKLRHLPEPARAAYWRFQSGAGAEELDIVIFAILADFFPRKPAPDLAAYPGDTALIDGLGFDSLAITEVVFFVEDLFGITISNEELMLVRTIDDLRGFVRRKISDRVA